jgi:hypothetical protein
MGLRPCRRLPEEVGVKAKVEAELVSPRRARQLWALRAWCARTIRCRRTPRDSIQSGSPPIQSISGCDELLGARPGLHTLRALDRAETLRERNEVLPRLLQPGDLGIDLRHSPTQKVLCVTTRTETAITDVQKLLDLLQTQSDALSALDEPEPLDSIVVKGPVPGWGAPRRGKKSFVHQSLFKGLNIVEARRPTDGDDQPPADEDEAVADRS